MVGENLQTRVSLTTTFIIILILTGCVKNPDNISSNTVKESISPNPNYSNNEKAIALAVSGCTQGSIWSEWINEQTWAPLLDWRGVAFKFIESSNSEVNDNYRFHIWVTDFTEQSFILAKTIDPKWKDLHDVWLESTLFLQKDMEKGKNVGEASGNASNNYGPRLDSICNLAFQEAKFLADKQNMKIFEWVKITGGKLIPPVYENISTN
jgi:hypothetical protein